MTLTDMARRLNNTDSTLLFQRISRLNAKGRLFPAIGVGSVVYTGSKGFWHAVASLLQTKHLSQAQHAALNHAFLKGFLNQAMDQQGFIGRLILTDEVPPTVKEVVLYTATIQQRHKYTGGTIKWNGNAFV